METTIGVLVLLVAISNLVMLVQLSNRLTRLAQPTVTAPATRKPRAKKVTAPAADTPATPPSSVL
jgi:hypothetical protein